MALLEAVSISKEYEKKQVLKEVSVSIDHGEVFTIIGHTGAGKTTMLKILDLLEKPTSGNLYFDGADVSHNYSARLKARRRMAFVQQKPAVFNMSVYDNVACGLKWRNEKKHNVRRKVDELLQILGMESYRDRNARTLSGGETQRVAIARALLTEPEVLFLDEPTANLDPISISKIEEVLAGIIREHKTTVFMATHDISQGQRLANKIGVMMAGQLVQVGSPNEIYFHPATREVAEFVGIENMLPGVVVGRNDDLITLDVNGYLVQAVSGSIAGDKIFVLIRPEDITFTLKKEISSARNIFPGVIKGLTPVGSLIRIEVDCGFTLLGVLTVQSAKELGFSIGKDIYASFKTTATHIIERIG